MSKSFPYKLFLLEEIESCQRHKFTLTQNLEARTETARAEISDKTITLVLRWTSEVPWDSLMQPFPVYLCEDLLPLYETYEGILFYLWYAWMIFVYYYTVTLVTLFLTNNTVRRLPVLWTTTAQRDVFIIAIGVHVSVFFTRTPLVDEEMTLTRLPRRRW